MVNFLIGFFSIALILLSLFITLIVLMQRPSANSGMGSSLGGGIAESAFGGESGNILTRYTIYAVVAFFVITFVLYLGNMSRLSLALGEPEGALPGISLMQEADASAEITAGVPTTSTQAPSEPAEF